MYHAAYVTSLNDMVDDFLPPQESEHPASEAINNVFAEIPAFRSERDMYEYIVGFFSTCSSHSLNSDIYCGRP